jgi:hypothetical protein
MTITYKLTSTRGNRRGGGIYHVVYISALWTDADDCKRCENGQTVRWRTGDAATKQAHNMVTRHAKANNAQAVITYQ